MKAIFGSGVKVLGLAFAAAVIGYTSLMTLKLTARLIPGDILMQIMTLVLFDGAALVWSFLFTKGEAKGTAQWVCAGFGFAVGLLGSITMMAGELILGQNLVVLDDPTKLGWIIVAVNVIAGCAHATLTYLFHGASPAIKNAIENSQKASELIERAYTRGRVKMDEQEDSLVGDLVQSVLISARKQIGAQVADELAHADRLGQRSEATLQRAGIDRDQVLRRPARIPGATMAPPQEILSDDDLDGYPPAHGYSVPSRPMPSMPMASMMPPMPVSGGVGGGGYPTDGREVDAVNRKVDALASDVREIGNAVAGLVKVVETLAGKKSREGEDAFGAESVNAAPAKGGQKPPRPPL